MKGFCRNASIVVRRARAALGIVVDRAAKIATTIVPAEALHFHNVITVWLGVLATVIAVQAAYRLEQTPVINKVMTRPVAVVDLAAVARDLRPSARGQMLAFFEAHQTLSRYAAAVGGAGQAAVAYFDDDEHWDELFSGATMELATSDDLVADLRMRLDESHRATFAVSTYNKGSPWWAFDQAVNDPGAAHLRKGPIGPGWEKITCCKKPNSLYDMARNYLDVADFPGGILTSTQKNLIETQVVRAIADPADVREILEAILKFKHIVKGLQLTNEEKFPVENTTLELEAFPVWATVAGPTADGFVGGGTPTFRLQRWSLATLYPGIPEYFILYTKSDGLWDEALRVKANGFQSAAQLAPGWWPFVLATCVVVAVAMIRLLLSRPRTSSA